MSLHFFEVPLWFQLASCKLEGIASTLLRRGLGESITSGKSKRHSAEAAFRLFKCFEGGKDREEICPGCKISPRLESWDLCLENCDWEIGKLRANMIFEILAKKILAMDVLRCKNDSWVNINFCAWNMVKTSQSKENYVLPQMVEINRCKWAECDHTSNVKRPCFKHMVTQCIEREDGALILTRLMLAALFIAQTDRSLSLIFICRIKDLSWFLKRGWDRCDIVVSCQIEEGQVQPFNPVKFSRRLADVFCSRTGRKIWGFACFFFPVSPDPAPFFAGPDFSDVDFCAFCNMLFTLLPHQRHPPYWTFHP